MVGLGNPGPQYTHTRHNAGFYLADAIAKHWRFPAFVRAGPTSVTDGYRDSERTVVVKPETYMNRSGRVIRALLDLEGFDSSEHLLVLVDDFALPLGSFRIRARGSSGGHNGLESVERALGSQEYARLRIGVGPVPDAIDPADWVLTAFADDEWDELQELLPTMVEAVDCWATDGVETAMNQFNRRGQQRD